MSTTTDLLDGFAQWLAAAGIGQDADVYTAGQTGITYKAMPETPDRVIALTLYPISDEPTQALGKTGLQVRCRGLPVPTTDVDDLADAIFDLVHGATHRQFGSVHVDQFLRHNTMPMGQDDNSRWERVDNYYLDFNTPSTANRPE